MCRYIYSVINSRGLDNIYCCHRSQNINRRTAGYFIKATAYKSWALSNEDIERGIVAQLGNWSEVQDLNTRLSHFPPPAPTLPSYFTMPSWETGAERSHHLPSLACLLLYLHESIVLCFQPASLSAVVPSHWVWQPWSPSLVSAGFSKQLMHCFPLSTLNVGSSSSEHGRQCSAKVPSLFSLTSRQVSAAETGRVESAWGTIPSGWMHRPRQRQHN